MSKVTAETIIVNGGGLTPAQALPDKVCERMDTAIDAWKQETSPFIVVSGRYSFLSRNIPDVSEASVMKRYALKSGVQENAILTEERSLETVGNALFTKTDIVMPRDWERLVVVTSKSHLPRTLTVFNHVYGKDFDIQGLAARERVGAKEKIWEFLGSVMVKEILGGTKPGDHDAIKERLFNLVPGYADGTFSHFTFSVLKGLLAKE